MKIIISGKQFKVDDNLRGYIEERLRKFEKLVSEPAILEVVLSDLMGPKGGVDKAVSLTMTLPGIKNPIHIEEVTSDYKGSIDLIEERLETQISKYKEQVKIGTRYPQKYHEAELEEEAEDEL
ncbi:MAG: ribosome-associated translation inhibitor RaiA [Patescibacteria group bacterium]|jgi:putative sigma-54 modulation protein